MKKIKKVDLINLVKNHDFMELDVTFVTSVGETSRDNNVAFTSAHYMITESFGGLGIQALVGAASSGVLSF